MHIDIILKSDNEEADVENIINLKKRLSENLAEVRLKQERRPLGPDDAAAGVLSALLNVVVGNEFINSVAEIIKEWVRSRPAIAEAKKRKLVIRVKKENGEETSIEVENIKDLDSIKELTESLK